MKNCAYYSIPLSQIAKDSCSIASEQFPLIVNCAGCNANQENFSNSNPAGREDYYLIYTVKGSLTFLFDHQYIKTTPGMLFILPPHYGYHLYAGSEPISYYWIHFTGSAVETVLNAYRLGSLPLKCQVGMDERIVSKIHLIFDSFVNGDLFREQELASRLDSVLRAFARLHSVNKNQSMQRIKASLEYISTNYNKRIPVSRLAQIEKLSVSRYWALFQQLVGMSPSQYIANLKIQWACELLAESDCSIKEVGHSVGYNDPKRFHYFFHTNMGISPSEYRRKKTGRKGVEE